MRRRPRLGLRARTTLGFGLIALVVAVVLAGLSYAVALQFWSASERTRRSGSLTSTPGWLGPC